MLETRKYDFSSSEFHTFTQSPQVFEEVLEHLQLPDTRVREDLCVNHNEEIHLSPNSSLIRPFMVSTRDIDRFKSWIGRADTAYSHGLELPKEPWNGSPIKDFVQLTEEAMSEIEKAYLMYLFGNSSAVRSYRNLLTDIYAPFEAAVYPIRNVVIRAGGTLILEGKPSILLFDNLDVESGGRLILLTACNAFIRRLQKSWANLA